MKLPTELHSIQDAGWPVSDWHILAHFDDASIVVYQAYRPNLQLQPHELHQGNAAPVCGAQGRAMGSARGDAAGVCH